MVIGLIQADLLGGNLEEKCTCRTVVMIPKRNDHFCGIGLVEVLWKNITGILNRCLTAAI